VRFTVVDKDRFTLDQVLVKKLFVGFIIFNDTINKQFNVFGALQLWSFLEWSWFTCVDLWIEL